MSYHIEVIVVDDSVPIVGGDRPEIIQSIRIGSTYTKREDATWLARECVEWGNTLVKRIVEWGKTHRKRS